MTAATPTIAWRAVGRYLADIDALRQNPLISSSLRRRADVLLAEAYPPDGGLMLCTRQDIRKVYDDLSAELVAATVDHLAAEASGEPATLTAPQFPPHEAVAAIRIVLPDVPVGEFYAHLDTAAQIAQYRLGCPVSTVDSGTDAEGRQTFTFVARPQ
jgi:hypothetical protein